VPKRLAEYLYGKREWTMERIAEALGVSQQQISKDLGGLRLSWPPAEPTTADESLTLSPRPEGRGALPRAV
jgi:hypothetical protein